MTMILQLQHPQLCIHLLDLLSPLPLNLLYPPLNPPVHLILPAYLGLDPHHSLLRGLILSCGFLGLPTGHPLLADLCADLLGLMFE